MAAKAAKDAKKTGPDAGKPSPARSTRARPAASGGGLTPGLSPKLGAEDVLGDKITLPTLSQGMAMSDPYLAVPDMSINSQGQPTFFKAGENLPAASQGAPSSMGPPPSRAWGGSLGNMMMTKSTGTGRSDDVSAGGGNSPGYFNNNELSELFSIVRGKNVFGGKKGKAPSGASGANKPPSSGKPLSGPAMSFDMSMSGMPDHMRSLPPIRTKSIEANANGGSLMSGGGLSGAMGESPVSDLPGSAGRLVTGLTPHGGMLMGTGLTPTGLTPGSLAGFPGIDHFSMNLPPGDGNDLLPGMPGWKDPTGGLGDDPNGNAPAAATGKKRKADSKQSGGSKPKAAKKANSKGGSKGKAASLGATLGATSDDDDVPLAGLVKQNTGGGQSAAALAEAAARRLGIPLPSQTVSTAMTGGDDEDDEEGTEGGGKGGTKSRSRSWLPSEDELVRSLVQQHGPRKWTLIATRLKTKTQKQVYARWRDYLQPGLTTKPWSAEEQQRLVELQAHVGNQWAVLARLMPGRSPNAIKNRFHATKRKLERHNKRDGSTLGPGGSEATGGGTVSMSMGDKNAAQGGVNSKKTKAKDDANMANMGAPSLAMSEEEYSKEEIQAVEGLLLADTPTSLMGQREAKEVDAHFDAALDIQDRLGEEANKAAKAAKGKKR